MHFWVIRWEIVAFNHPERWLTPAGTLFALQNRIFWTMCTRSFLYAKWIWRIRLQWRSITKRATECICPWSRRTFIRSYLRKSYIVTTSTSVATLKNQCWFISRQICTIQLDHTHIRYPREWWQLTSILSWLHSIAFS